MVNNVIEKERFDWNGDSNNIIRCKEGTFRVVSL